MHVRYPIVADRVLGLGELPSVRLQRALARQRPEGPRWRALDRVLVWTHWSWFLVPHGTVAYMLVRHPARFPRARDADLRGLQPRRERLLAGADRAALVRGRGRSSASGEDRPSPRCGA